VIIKVIEMQHEETWKDDGNAARIIHVDDGEENGMFVCIQSWEQDLLSPRVFEGPEHHADLKKLEGKRIRVTVETIDD